MNAIRRTYIYIVAFISLQVLVWGGISLIRNLLEGADRLALAWQVAVLIVGTPIFAAHWVWANRLRATNERERNTVQRRFYLFAVMASMLGPFLVQAVTLLDDLLDYITLPNQTWPGTSLRDALGMMLVTAAVWGMHYWLWRRDSTTYPESAVQAAVRRLYQWGFTLVALVMVLVSLNSLISILLSWMTGQINENDQLLAALPQLLVGLPLLVACWRWNQQLLANNTADEQASVLRKLYLYGVLFVTLIMTVSNVAILLAQGLQWLWGIETTAEWTDIIAVIIPVGGAWLAHWVILRGDEHLTTDVWRQITIRQVYQYLSAGVGLCAFFIGVAGLLSVLIRAVAGESYERTEIAWFLATLLAGFPVWLWFWQKIRRAVSSSENAEYDSLVRRTYLYIILFLATLIILSTGVYLVYWLTTLIMGLTLAGNTAVEVAQSVAFGLLALGVWAYHGRLIRTDSTRWETLRTTRLAEVGVLVLVSEQGGWGEQLASYLRRTLPSLALATAVANTDSSDEESNSLPQEIAEADIIIAPWTTVTPLSSWDTAVIEAIISASAQKLLLPVPRADWHWVGRPNQQAEQILAEAGEAVSRLATTESDVQERRWGFGLNVLAAAMGFGLLLFAWVLIFIQAVSYGF